MPVMFQRNWVYRLGLLLVAVLSPLALAAGKAEHVVIVVMDGLRADSVTPEQMPTLAALGKSGTFFAHHHPVYVSSTEVNGTALATGKFPEHSGITGNRMYAPDVELLEPVDTQNQWAAWKGDKLTDGKWINAPTLPQLARAQGLTTVVAGTKAVAMLWDRSIKDRSIDQPTLFEGKSIPSALLDKILPEYGPMPPAMDTRYFANRSQDGWTTRVLTEKLWANGVPKLSVLWLSEPDFSQHGSGVGSDNSKAGLKSSDDRLATVLSTLEKKGIRDKTDVVVVSDHGFSTISRNVDLYKEMRQRGFFVGGLFLEKPDAGDILLVGLGGSVTFYVAQHDQRVLGALVRYLQMTDWAGVIFTKDGLEGTFKLSDVGLDAPTSPDVVVAMRWKDEMGPYGMPGTILTESALIRGQGMHGSLSRYDMHNTLVAAGPDFKSGFVDQLPSANSDVSPTLAHILGIQTKDPMDGRVLAEALVDEKAPEGEAKTTTMRATRTIGERQWVQYLRVTTFQGRRYYDQGNAGEPPEK